MSKTMEPGECQATFVVRVSKKPNEPWQGNVVWVSERCERNFSNMQELFSLMDETLQTETDLQDKMRGGQDK